MLENRLRAIQLRLKQTCFVLNYYIIATTKDFIYPIANDFNLHLNSPSLFHRISLSTLDLTRLHSEFFEKSDKDQYFGYIIILPLTNYCSLYVEFLTKDCRLNDAIFAFEKIKSELYDIPIESLLVNSNLLKKYFILQGIISYQNMTLLIDSTGLVTAVSPDLTNENIIGTSIIYALSTLLDIPEYAETVLQLINEQRAYIQNQDQMFFFKTETYSMFYQVLGISYSDYSQNSQQFAELKDFHRLLAISTAKNKIYTTFMSICIHNEEESTFVNKILSILIESQLVISAKYYKEQNKFSFISTQSEKLDLDGKLLTDILDKQIVVVEQFVYILIADTEIYGILKCQLSDSVKIYEVQDIFWNLTNLLNTAMHYYSQPSVQAKSLTNTTVVNAVLNGIEYNPRIIYVADKQGIFQYCNKRFTDIYQYKTEEIIGKSIEILKSGHTNAETYNQMWAAINEGKEFQGFFKNKAKDGTIITVSSVVMPLYDHLGKFISIITFHSLLQDTQIIKSQIFESKEAELFSFIARDFGYDFINIISGINLNLVIFERNASSNAKLLESIKSVKNLLDIASKMSNQLVNLSSSRNYTKELIAVQQFIAKRIDVIFPDFQDNSQLQLIFKDEIVTKLIPEYFAHILFQTANFFKPSNPDEFLRITIDRIFISSLQSTFDAIDIPRNQQVVWIKSKWDRTGMYISNLSDDLNLRIRLNKFYLSIYFDAKYVYYPVDIFHRLLDYGFKDIKYKIPIGLASVYAMVYDLNGFITGYSDTKLGTGLSFFIPIE